MKEKLPKLFKNYTRLVTDVKTELRQIVNNYHCNWSGPIQGSSPQKPVTMTTRTYKSLESHHPLLIHLGNIKRVGCFIYNAKTFLTIKLRFKKGFRAGLNRCPSDLKCSFTPIVDEQKVRFSSIEKKNPTKV